MRKDIDIEQDTMEDTNERIGTEERPISVDEAKSYGVTIELD